MDDISSLLSSLSSSDMEKLKGIASSFMGEKTEEKPKENSSPLASLGLSEAMLAPLMSSVQQLGAKDERTEFIKALRPLLSDERKVRADEAMKFLQLMKLLPTLKDSGLF